MSLYNIKIDGRIIDKTYTYSELQELDVMAFDDIYIKEISQNTWVSAQKFKFANKQLENYSIDEFGQIVRKGYNDNNNPRREQQKSTQESIRNNNSDNSELWEAAGKIFLTLLILAIIIGLAFASVGIATPALAYGGSRLIRSIWND